MKTEFLSIGNLYNKIFEDYKRQMLWLSGKNWPPTRKLVVCEDITERIEQKLHILNNRANKFAKNLK
jgi:hypothetical protein